MNVYLIGFRGSGKTTVGKQLAERLGVLAVDSDDLIEQTAGATIREIFQREGESGFRDREENAVRHLSSLAGSKPQVGTQDVAEVVSHVVSLGGGAILREANRTALASSGVCIWLTASPERLVERIHSDKSTAERRPALSQLNEYDEVVAILKAREPLYSAIAQKIVNTEDTTVEAICDEIINWLNQQ